MLLKKKVTAGSTIFRRVPILKDNDSYICENYKCVHRYGGNKRANNTCSICAYVRRNFTPFTCRDKYYYIPC